ncbi:ribosomal subunit interface protein [Candidatus Giovannonibacteria bacterium RIFCSPHIGHO2_02_43_13]|uniref:Ribosomal subunit interface protein n=1 Tax=Candidatus Giovannonibacteria bacterium RIFCSPHIGHO2_02_43_13 TaxID=1798330 RepID=A0A1F5WPT9_9BACT|nr:MAG: hypothetical protein UW28_C0003G0019 [Parcubacteria group bacterium GW2011_GWA2_44_13]OGF73149.1 MAG: ribosomal subunit interface protein [Candidatus Giovannonibacteria bacterium RIFCSPHIGHO2_12_FULL_44_42]OGF77668.1 MAG: ribosomal subunit interface protein [Candidatus Giovannonibacteria bacterium RIFCSPHIGHO2_02_43_13]
MKISLKGTNIQILESTREYVDKKLVKAAEKYLKDGDDAVSLAVEVEKTTNHHKKGADVFCAEANLRMGKVSLRAEATAEALNDAIDQVEEELTGEIKKFKEKKRTEMLKGARWVREK